MASVNSGPGDDVILGTSGSDRIHGGSGNDTLIYRFAQNVGTRDFYTGGAGVDTLRLEFTAAEWRNPVVEQELARFYQYLQLTPRNPRGEISDAWLGDFTFRFPDRTLNVQSVERLEVFVDGARIADLDRPFVSSAVTARAVREDGDSDTVPATSQSATGTVRFFDLDLTDNHVVSVAAPTGVIGSLRAILTDRAYRDGQGTVTWTYTLDNTAAQALAGGQTRIETFTVRIADANNAGAFVDTRVTITVTGVNDAVTITSAAQSGAVTEVADGGAGENATLHGVSGAVTFIDADTLDIHGASFVPQGGGAGYRGTFTLDPLDQSANSVGWRFSVSDADLDTLRAAQVLTQRYDVSVGDGHGGTATQTVTITIAGRNDAPVANADSYSVNEDTTLVVAAGTGLVANDTDRDADALSAILVTGPTHGTLTLNAAGSFSYTPNANYFGTDSFSYKASDGSADSGAAKVTISIADLVEGKVVRDDIETGTPLRYFMRVEGVTSDWVELDAFSWGLDNTSTSVSTGVLVPNDVRVTLGSSAAVAKLVETVGKGTTVNSVEIEAYVGDPSGGNTGLRLVDEFRFEGARVSALKAVDGVETHHEVGFAYTKFGHSHILYDETGGKDGTRTGEVVSAFDFTSRKTYTPSFANTLDLKAKQPEVTESQLDYYVRFEGVGGAGEWLRLEGFNMGLGRVIDPPGGSPGSHPLTASDVLLTLGSSSQLVQLNTILNKSEQLTKAEIEAYAPGGEGDSPRLIDEYRFEAVTLTGLDTINATQNTLSFESRKVSHGHVSYDAAGRQAGTVSEGYDFSKGTSFDGVTPAVDAAKAAIIDGIAAGTPLRYFMRVEGVTSDWVELDAFSWGLDNTSTSVSTGVLVPNDVRVTLGSSAAVAKLVETVGKGTTVNSVEIEAYVGDPSGGNTGLRLVDEFRFEGARVSALKAVDGVETHHEVGFAYTKFGHSHILYDETGGKDGTRTGEVVSAFDFTSRKTYTPSFANTLDLKAKQPEATTSELDYYVRFEGVGGAGEWLRLEGFNMGLSRVIDPPGGSPGSHPLTPSDVLLTLGSSSQLVQLNTILNKSEQLTKAEIEAYAPGGEGDSPRLIDEYRFEAVTLTGLDTINATQNTLSFESRKVSHGHVSYDAAGRQAGTVSEGYDFSKGTSFDGVTPAVDAAKATIIDGIAAGTPLRYFMRVEGVTSDWVELDAFSWGLDNTSTSVSTGVLVPNDVRVTLGSSAAVAKLVETVGKGTTVNSVEIEAYVGDPSGGNTGLRLVDEFRFEGARVSALKAVDGVETHHEVGFAYTKFGHSHILYDETGGKDGTRTGEVVSAFDFTSRKTYTPSFANTLDLKAKQPEATTSELDYYVRFEGVGGAGEWLRLEGFNMGLSRVIDPPGGSPGSHPLTPSDVLLTLGSSSQLVQLNTILNKSEQLTKAEIEAYAPGGEGDSPRLIDEYRFEAVTLTGLDTINATQNTLSFESRKVSHGHVSYDAAGRQAGTVSEGYDFTKGTSFDGVTPMPDINFSL